MRGAGDLPRDDYFTEAIEIVEAIPRTAAMKVSRPGVLALFGTTPVTTTPVT